VVVRASSPDQAEERVTQALPPGGDYTIERVIPVDEG
jgi:hypothetical protein